MENHSVTGVLNPWPQQGGDQDWYGESFQFAAVAVDGNDTRDEANATHAITNGPLAVREEAPNARGVTTSPTPLIDLAHQVGGQRGSFFASRPGESN